MRHVDSLSRMVEVNVIDQNSLEQILAVEQSRDQNIITIRDSLINKKDCSLKFELHDGLVYRKIQDKLLFYDPSTMEENVIRCNHDDMGHL